MIPFNKPYLSGKELEYISDSLRRGHISGNGYYTKKCQSFFAQKFNLGKCLMTTSCTDALEMCAILLDIQPGDEVIMPSYNFVSAANAFMKQGAKIKFVDSTDNHPNSDVEAMRSLITSKTKAIVVVHYGGVACEMDKLLALVNEFNIKLVEDAAHAIGGTFKGKYLGSFGSLSTFSFHETKNLTSGEGGMLVINENEFEERAEIIWEKGTNRTAFYRGEVNKYKWVDTGSSFLPSELNAAFLYAQFECFEQIQQLRQEAWKRYASLIQPLGDKGFLDVISWPGKSTNVAHMFSFLVKDESVRDELLEYLKTNNVLAVFHYLPLHLSPYYLEQSPKLVLSNSEKFASRIVRLPFYTEIDESTQVAVVNHIKSFFASILN